MKTQIGIKPEDSVQVADSLKVIGKDFAAQHIFFEGQYRELEDIIDQVAERIRAIGHYTEGTMEDYLKLTQLIEKSRENNDSLSFIKDLLSDHESVIIEARENITRFDEEWHDLGSSDFLTGIMKAHEKMAWMLRSHLQ